MMTVAALVTPANSREDDDADAFCWLHKMESGATLSSTDWDRFAQAKDRIPWLNEQQQDEGVKIIRVRGMMVQDMLDDEYFSTTVNDGGAPLMAERTPLWVTPIPWSTPWFRKVLWDDASDPNPKRWRPSEEEEDMDGTGTAARMHNNDSDPRETPVLAKFYYDQYKDIPKKLRLNELVEIVGVVEDATGETDHHLQHPEEDPLPSALSWELDMPIPNHIPRVHVLWFQRTDLDAILTPNVPWQPRTEQIPDQLSRMWGVSGTVAAAVWMALLSKAERQCQQQAESSGDPVKTPDEALLGCASLNVVLDSPAACTDFESRLVGVLSQIVPQLHCLKVTPEAVTSPAFAMPAKVRGRLAPTPFQLPMGSTLILNTGAMPATFVPNESSAVVFQALQELCLRHQVPYSFEGAFLMPFEADIRIIVLSTPSNHNLLRCSLQVKAAVTATIPEQVGEPPFLHMRTALAACRAANNIGLTQSVLNRAQQDFLQRRSNGRSGSNGILPGQDDFHRWLTLTRLQARNRQAFEALVDDWRLALELDDAMVATLSLS